MTRPLQQNLFLPGKISHFRTFFPVGAVIFSFIWTAEISVVFVVVQTLLLLQFVAETTTYDGSFIPNWDSDSSISFHIIIRLSSTN